MNFSGSPPTMFSREDLSVLKISTSEFIGIHGKQSSFNVELRRFGSGLFSCDHASLLR